jgi:hypothetical protein
MVACAVLVQMGWSLADAFRLISSRRGITAMNEAQLAILRELSAEVARDAVAPAPAFRNGLEPAESSIEPVSIHGHRQRLISAS